MFTKRLLFLTNHRLVSVVWKLGQALDCQIFPLTQEGRLAFSRHVAPQPGIPAYILTELVEEDFRSDVIPHVMMRDRRAILDRKLTQIYRSTHYRLGIIQGREPDGRRDDRVLYTAITNPELVRPWVEMLAELGTPLAGVYSAPLLSAELLKSLKVTSEHALLASVETGGGLRQSYFYQGEIKFSRLTPVSEIPRDELPAFIADEVGKTWQYLDSLRYFTRADALDVFVLAHPHDHPEISNAAPSIAQLQYNVVNIHEVAARVGLRDPLPDSDATPIFIQLLGKRPPRGQFASHDETYGMRVWRARVGLYAASALVLATGALWGGYNAYLTFGKVNQMQHIEATARSTAQQHQAAVHGRPPSPVSPTVMRDSVTLYDTLASNSPSPAHSMQEISQVLDRFPNIRIQQIVWGLANDANATLGHTPSANPENAPLKSSRAETPAASLAAPTESADALGGAYQVTIMDADIYPFNGDYRVALREIERFENALKSLPGIQVSILSRPVDLTSDVTLIGRPTMQSSPPEARFSVKITKGLAKT